MNRRDRCIHTGHSNRAAPEIQTTTVELILYYLKEGAIILLILLALYPLLAAL